MRPQLEVRFQKPVTILQLTATQLGIAHHKSRHKLGLNHPAPLHQENPLPFFSLLTTFPVEHPPHNRVVCGEIRSWVGIGGPGHARSEHWER